MIDAIYELYTGEYIDFSNLIIVDNVYFHDTRWGCSEDEIRGNHYFDCRFRFTKDVVRFYDKQVTGEKEIEERKKYVEQQRSRMVQEWMLFKGLEST